MLKNYIKMALKVLLRRKVFTCISLFTISFTLMVLMVMTALFDHVFGSFPPETRADRTLVMKMITGEHTEEAGKRVGQPSYAFLKRYVSPLTQAERVSISTWFLVPGSNVSQGREDRIWPQVHGRGFLGDPRIRLPRRPSLYRKGGRGGPTGGCDQ